MSLWTGYACWRCGAKGTVVTLDLLFDGGEEGLCWNEDDGLGQAVQRRHPTYYKDYSRMAGGRYWANHCAECDALLGDFYVMEATLGKEPDSTWTMPWKPTLVEERYEEVDERRWGHIHHRDGNPANNSVENLALLCVQCHAGRHRTGSLSSGAAGSTALA